MLKRIMWVLGAPYRAIERLIKKLWHKPPLKYGLMQTLTQEQADHIRETGELPKGATDAFIPNPRRLILNRFVDESGKTKVTGRYEDEVHPMDPRRLQAEHVCKPATSSLWTCACEENGYNAAMRAMKREMER